MAGVPVATLNIEIVAEIARLQEDMRRAEKAVGDMSRVVGGSARAMNDNFGSVNKSTSRMRNGMQQLSFQLNDVSAQMATGTQASVIFAQQSGQVIQAVQGMAGGTSKFANFMGGPWGIAISVGVSALAALWAMLGKSKDAAEKANKAHETLADKINLTKHSYEEVTQAVRDYNAEQSKARQLTLDAAAATAVQASNNIKAALAERQKLQAQLETAYSAASNTGGRAANFGGNYISPEQNAAVKSLQEQMRRNAADLRSLAAGARNAVGDVAGEMAKIMSDPAYAIEQKFKGLRNEAEASNLPVSQMAARIAEINRQEQATLKTLREANREREEGNRQLGRNITLQEARAIAEGVGGRVTSTQRSTAKQQELYDKYMAYKSGDGPWAALAAKPGTSNHELGQALDVAKSDGVTLKKLVAAYRAAGVSLTEALDEGSHFHIAWKATGAKAKEIREIEAAAKAAAKEAEKLAKWLADARLEANGNVGKLASDMAARQKDWADTDFAAKNGPVLGKYDVKVMEDAEKLTQERLEGERQILDYYLRQLDTIQRMGGALGGAAGVVAGILDGGNFAGIGGKLGTLLNLSGSAVGKDGWEQVTKKLDTVFGGEGAFQKTMTTVLQNAGMGAAASSLILGKDGSKLGASIGGAIGGKVGEKFLSKGFESLAKGLGDFAGPIGSIVGGVLGSAIGGLMKKTKWGAVDLSSNGASAARGNSETAQKAAVSVGDNVMASLNQIAEAFGGGVGDFGNITVGQRHGDWRVNTGSSSLKIKSGATEFDDDAEGAIAFAIQTAIERGAIDGIRASTEKLLQASGDLQTKLQKALSFEGVFSDLKARLDPTGSALEQLDKKFAALRATFAEAGATTEEYTQLEQLLGLQRKDILDAAAKESLDNLNEQRSLEVRLLEAQGKASEAVALQRAIELSQTKDELKGLMAQVQAAEAAQEAAQSASDAAAKLAADAANAASLLNQRRSMEATLLEAMGQTAAATALKRQAELEAMDASLRPMQRQIYAWQDLATAQEAAAEKVANAKDVLTQAYNRESSTLEATASKFKDFAKTIADFRTGLIASAAGGGYDQARARFENTATMAQFGNEASLSAFTGDVSTFLDASRSRASSAIDYARDVARVTAAALKAEAGATGVATQAEQQLAALKVSVSNLIDLNDNVLSVAQAIADLNKAQAESDRLQVDTSAAALSQVNLNLTDMSGIISRLNGTQAATTDQIAALRAEMQAALISIASNTGETSRILRRADRGDALATQVEVA